MSKALIKNKRKIHYEYVPRKRELVIQESTARISKLNSDYDHQKVKSFIAPLW